MSDDKWLTGENQRQVGSPGLEEFEDPGRRQKVLGGLDGGVGEYENTLEECSQREVGSDIIYLKAQRELGSDIV